MHRSSSVLSAVSTDSGGADDDSSSELRPLKRGYGRSNKDLASGNNNKRGKAVSPDHTNSNNQSYHVDQPPRKKPHRLIVDQPTTLNDNSIITLNPEKLSELQLFRGDIVLLQGKLHHTAVAVG